jgi:hypothetical protein
MYVVGQQTSCAVSACKLSTCRAVRGGAGPGSKSGGRQGSGGAAARLAEARRVARVVQRHGLQPLACQLARFPVPCRPYQEGFSLAEATSTFPDTRRQAKRHPVTGRTDACPWQHGSAEPGSATLEQRSSSAPIATLRIWDRARVHSGQGWTCIRPQTVARLYTRGCAETPSGHSTPALSVPSRRRLPRAPRPARTRDDGHGVDLLQHQLLGLAQQLAGQHDDRGRAVTDLRILHLADVCAPPARAASRPCSRAPDVVPILPLCHECAAPRSDSHAPVHDLVLLPCKHTASAGLWPSTQPQAGAVALPPAFCNSTCQRNSWKHCEGVRLVFPSALYFPPALGAEQGVAGWCVGGPHLQAPLQPGCPHRAT